MRPDPASTLPHALACRETKPLCATGESEPAVALAIAIVWALLVVGVGLAVWWVA